MKLFGGGGGRKKNKKEYYEDPKPASGSRTAPKPQKKGRKKPLTRAQKQKRVIIGSCVAAALMLVVAAGAIWVHFNVRAPIPDNDPTIKDPENGDAVDVSELLNAGTRVDDLFTFVIGALDEDKYRTDALMVATMDAKKKTVNIMNIPRDTMCNNGTSGASRKINAAYGMRTGGKGGNIEQTKKEIERLLGFRPDKYIIVDFDGIAAIVDAIGGVDYEVPFRMQYDDPAQNLHIDLMAGMQHLNGKQTVEFLRWRHNNDFSAQYQNGDEGRVENQQKFLKYLAGQVFQMKNVTKIGAIADAVFKNVKTDFTAGQMLWMGMQAVQVKNDNIRFFTLPGYGQMSTAGSDPIAYSFYFPYYQETLDLVNQYLNPFAEDIERLDLVSGPENYKPNTAPSSGEEDNVWGDSNQTPPEQADPENPDEPTADPTDPANPATPIDPIAPTNPDEPTAPDEPTPPTEPDTPSDPVTPPPAPTTPTDPGAGSVDPEA